MKIMVFRDACDFGILFLCIDDFRKGKGVCCGGLALLFFAIFTAV